MSDIKLTEPQIEELIQTLQGSCMSFDDGIQAVLDTEDFVDSNIITTEQHEHIDSEIFNCTTCGWWYEVCEMADNDDESEPTCDSCYDEQ